MLTRSQVEIVRCRPAAARDGPAGSPILPNCRLPADCTSTCSCWPHPAARKSVLDLAVERGQPVGGVARSGRVKVQHITVGGDDAEILMFQIVQRFRHQNCAR